MKRLTTTVFIIILLFTSCKNETNKTISKNDTKITSPEKELKIHPISHATMVLEYEDVTIYVDPVGGKEAFKEQKEPSLILVTDIHGDHFNLETIKAFNAPLIAPKAVIDKIEDTVGMNNVILNNGNSETFEFGNTTIFVEAIPMYNLPEDDTSRHPKGRGNGYVLTLGDKRIYISGDTEDIPEMRQLVDIDKAFVCMNLPYTMTVESAASAVLEFKPKQIYPYHYRGKEGFSDVKLFETLINKANNKIEVVQLNWYPKQK